MALVICTIYVHAIPAGGEANSSLEIGPETFRHSKDVLLVPTCEQNGLMCFIAAVECSGGIRMLSLFGVTFTDLRVESPAIIRSPGGKALASRGVLHTPLA